MNNEQIMKLITRIMFGLINIEKTHILTWPLSTIPVLLLDGGSTYSVNKVGTVILPGELLLTHVILTPYLFI